MKYVAIDLVGNVLYWPVWWYTVGLKDFVLGRFVAIKRFEGDIGLTIWVVNWGKPMYGQYDIGGKIISFIIRTLGIIFKVVQLLIISILEMVLIVVWVLVPLLAIFQLIRYVI